MKRKIRIKSLLILMLICIGVGFFIAYKFINPNKNNSVKIVPSEKNAPTKVISNDILIKTLQQKQELITLEVELTANITVDNSWGTFDVFKKYQNIHFAGKGVYVVDLSNLQKEKINIDSDEKSINITIPKPFIKTIYVDNEKTVFESTQNGVFRFGEIKLTTEEFNFLTTTAKNNMNEKIQGKEIFNEALEKSKQSVTNLINPLLPEYKEKDFQVNILFE